MGGGRRTKGHQPQVGSMDDRQSSQALRFQHLRKVGSEVFGEEDIIGGVTTLVYARGWDGRGEEGLGVITFTVVEAWLVDADWCTKHCFRTSHQE